MLLRRQGKDRYVPKLGASSIRGGLFKVNRFFQESLPLGVLLTPHRQPVVKMAMRLEQLKKGVPDRARSEERRVGKECPV